MPPPSPGYSRKALWKSWLVMMAHPCHRCSTSACLTSSTGQWSFPPNSSSQRGGACMAMRARGGSTGLERMHVLHALDNLLAAAAAAINPSVCCYAAAPCLQALCHRCCACRPAAQQTRPAPCSLAVSRHCIAPSQGWRSRLLATTFGMEGWRGVAAGGACARHLHACRT